MDHQALAQLLGNYGEFVGAIAVVVTLGYLAFQIRQNSESLRANAYQEMTKAANEWGNLFIGRPAVAGLFRRGLDDYSSLNPDERIQFNQISSTLFRNFAVALDLTERGLVPHGGSPADVYEQSLLSMFSHPGMRHWWKSQPKSGGKFESHVDALLEKAASPSNGIGD